MLDVALSNNLVQSVMICLSVFDWHNLVQVNKKMSKFKKTTKDRYAQYCGYKNYVLLYSFYRSLNVFKVIDVLDTRDVWCEAYIIGQQVYKNTINIKVKYMGYSDNWNEWLRADTGRIAENGKYTYTGKNELQRGNQFIYYYRNKWIVCIFLEFYKLSLVPMIKFKYKNRVCTGVHIKSYIAPVSRRNIIL